MQLKEIFKSVCSQIFFNNLNTGDFSSSSLMFYPHFYFGLQKEGGKIIKGEGNIKFISSVHFWVVLLLFNFMYLHLHQLP